MLTVAVVGQVVLSEQWRTVWKKMVTFIHFREGHFQDKGFLGSQKDLPVHQTVLYIATEGQIVVSEEKELYSWSNLPQMTLLGDPQQVKIESLLTWDWLEIVLSVAPADCVVKAKAGHSDQTADLIGLKWP